MDQRRAVAIHRQRFANAADFTFVIVGKVDLTSLQPLVETYLGALPSTGRKETFRDVKVKTVRGPADKRYFAGKDPKSRVEIVFHDQVVYSRADDEDLGALAQAMEYRLRDRLREQLGSTYAISVSGSEWRRPRGESFFQLYFDCAPDQADQSRRVALQEIEKARQGGFDGETIEKLRNERRRAFETNRRDNYYWLNQLVDRIRYGEDPRDILSIDERVTRLTGRRLQALAVKHLDPRRAITATLMPESSARPLAKIPARVQARSPRSSKAVVGE
jgi:zinc protease